MNDKEPMEPMALVVERQIDRLIEVECCLRDPARPTSVTNLADEVLDIRCRLDRTVGGRRQVRAV